MHWEPFANSQTLGLTGNEGGVIEVDDEYREAARITLEKNCLRAPYAITSSVYMYLMHTRFVADDETALYALDEMKAALASIVDMLPTENDEDDADRLNAALDAVETFKQRFP